MSHPLPGPLERLGKEVRSACRAAVDSVSSAEGIPSGVSASRVVPHRLALGEWLDAVRQPRQEGGSHRFPRRGPSALDEPRGDLSRTHIMRLKGERAHLDDGITRSSRYFR